MNTGQLLAEAQASADAMREAAVELKGPFPEIVGLLEASARIVESLADEVARLSKPRRDPK